MAQRKTFLVAESWATDPHPFTLPHFLATLTPLKLKN